MIKWAVICYLIQWSSHSWYDILFLCNYAAPTAPHVFIASSTHVKLKSSLCTWYSIIARRRTVHNGKMSEPVIRSTPGSDRWAAITEHSCVHGRTERDLNIEYEKDHFPPCLGVSIRRNLAYDRNSFVCRVLTILRALKESHFLNSPVLRMFLESDGRCCCCCAYKDVFLRLFACHESLIILQLVFEIISGSLSSLRSPGKFTAAPNTNDYFCPRQSQSGSYSSQVPIYRKTTNTHWLFSCFQRTTSFSLFDSSFLS